MRITLVVTADVPEGSATLGELGLDLDAPQDAIREAIAEELQSTFDYLGATTRVDNLRIAQLQLEVEGPGDRAWTYSRDSVARIASELVQWTKEDA